MARNDTDLNSLLESFKEAAESKGYKDRKEARLRIREHCRAKHWGNENQIDPVANPSLQLTWLAIQRAHPKIFNGYSFEPEVVPEANQDYLIDPEAPLRQAIAQVAAPNKTEHDSEREAKIKTALAQRLWEQAGGLSKIKEGAEGSLWYGEWWFLDGWDGSEPFIDLLHPDYIRLDPDAKSLKESRFIGYIVDRTLAELRETYPDKADEIRRSVSNDDDKYKELPEDKVNVPLECWFIKDNSKKTIVDRETVTPESLAQFLDDGYEVVAEDKAFADPIVIDGIPHHPQAMVPVDVVPAKGFEIVVSYQVERKREEPKYPGGWRHVRRVNRCVVFDGPSSSASGELPLHWLPCFPTPGELGGALGIPDQAQDINRMVDILYAEGIKYVRTAMPGLITREGTLEESSAELIQIPGGPPVLKVPADEDTPINQVVMPYSFAELPASFQAMIDRLVNMLEQVTGSYDLQGQNAAYDALSGEAVEQLETAANARNTSFRERIREVCRCIVRNMLANAEKYAETTYSVDVQVGGEYRNLDVDPKIFDVSDFERKFDVVIGSSDTLPQAGKARNEAILAAVGALTQLGPTLAPALLDVLEIPEKQTIESALTQHFQAMSQNAPPDPMQVKQAESKLDINKRFNESLADGLEDFAKRKDLPPLVSLRALQYLQAAAMGEPMPPLQQLIQELTGMTLPQPSAIPQGAMAPPMTGVM